MAQVTPAQYGQTPNQTGNAFFDASDIPGYAPTYDPNSMSAVNYLGGVLPQYQTGINKFKQEALRTGPSNWLNMNMLKADQDTQGAKENARRGSNAMVSEDLDRLAAGGGLSSGARERAGEAGMKNYLGMSQDLTKNNMSNKLGLSIQDEGNRMNQLSMLPGMEQSQVNAWTGAHNQDIANQQRNIAGLNEYNSNLYGQRMQAGAAERSAQATEHSGKK